MIERLGNILQKKSAKLIKLDYYKKIFGNIVVEIEKQGVVHEFITDRGEIVYNGKGICDNSYHIKGKNDTFDKLCEVIEQVL